MKIRSFFRNNPSAAWWIAALTLLIVPVIASSSFLSIPKLLSSAFLSSAFICSGAAMLAATLKNRLSNSSKTAFRAKLALSSLGFAAGIGYFVFSLTW